MITGIEKKKTMISAFSKQQSLLFLILLLSVEDGFNPSIRNPKEGNSILLFFNIDLMGIVPFLIFFTCSFFLQARAFHVMIII